MRAVDAEIQAARVKARKKRKRLAIRANCTSDFNIRLFKLDGKLLIEKYSRHQWYDYTKTPAQRANVDLFPNYHITWSYSEINAMETRKAISEGFNVAVPFAHSLPETFLGLPVIDGDETDFRPSDPSQCIVGLKVKLSTKEKVEKAIKAGFIVETERAGI